MQIISDTLKAVVETWDDPGDYPNSLAQSPLPSYQYVAEVSGEIVLELESADFIDGDGGGLEVETDLPYGIKVRQWNIDVRHGQQGGRAAAPQVVLTVAEFDADRVERDEEEY